MNDVAVCGTVWSWSAALEVAGTVQDNLASRVNSFYCRKRLYEWFCPRKSFSISGFDPRKSFSISGFDPRIKASLQVVLIRV